MLRNRNGFSLVELMLAAGLIALVIGLTTQSVVQMKKMEKQVDFQMSLDVAHQLALQKARNGTFLKEKLGFEIAGTQIDECFGGRGTGCAAFQKTNFQIDTESVHRVGSFGATSTTNVSYTCSSTTCNLVTIQVETVQTAFPPTSNWKALPLRSEFSIPAAALASRQEIDFSSCMGGTPLSGIDYTTLTAECVPFTGLRSCASIGGTGPMLSFGGTPTDPASCQVPVAQSCAAGLAEFGLIDGQASCAGTPPCTDPFSTACTPPPPPPCVPNWQPDVSTVCAGAPFTQNDLNSCPGSVATAAVGTNAAVCTTGPCTFTGTVKWPNPTTGPCEDTAANLNAAAGANATTSNQRLGFAGTFTVTCMNNAPAPNTFNMAGATNSCAPITCSGLASSIEWGSAGVRSGAAGSGFDPAGPWSCNGPLNITPSAGPGVLLSVQADGSATATASSTAAGNTGTATLVCNDPGPANGVRSGVLTATSSCTASTNCSPVGSNYLWNGVNWDDYGSPSWNMSLIGMTSSSPPPTIAGASMDMGRGVRFLKTPATMQCGAAPPPDKCWRGADVPVRNGVACDSLTVTGFYDVNFKTQSDCISTASTHPNYDLMCVSGGVTPIDKANIMCQEVTVSDVNACSNAGNISSGPPAPPPPPPPACQPTGFMTGVWSGADDARCVDQSFFAGFGPDPYPTCCSGVHKANYTGSDTVGGGNCNWTCQ